MPSPVLPPLHLTSSDETSVSSLLMAHANLLGLPALELLPLGAVYLNRRRVLEDAPMRKGDVLRVHPCPRRFPAWQARLVHENDRFLVVDKPAGLPVHPTCDNARENLIAQLEGRWASSLWICHRLDIATQGLVVLAKTKEFCAEFNRWTDGRQLTKRYRALIPHALDRGAITHYMAPGDRAPHLVSPESKAQWKICEMSLDRVAPHGAHWEAEMTLGTGRHHQIRAQLSALGAPVLGDDLYGSTLSVPMGIGEGECIALQAFELTFPDGNRFELSRPW